MGEKTLVENGNRIVAHPLGRRVFLGSMVATGALAVSGCQSFGGFSLVDAVRRLLFLSSERAFARMLAPGGYWDDAVGTIGLDSLIGARGGVVAGLLTSTIFKDRLEGAFADIAIEGSARAAPLVTDAVRVIGIDNAVALVSGGPTAASSFLRGQMGSSLIEAMVPELGEAMRIAQEPLVGQLLAQLTGVDVGGVSRNLSGRVDTAIWNEIGVEEAAIRRNPGATGDPLLIGVFAASGAL